MGARARLVELHHACQYPQLIYFFDPFCIFFFLLHPIAFLASQNLEIYLFFLCLSSMVSITLTHRLCLWLKMKTLPMILWMFLSLLNLGIVLRLGNLYMAKGLKKKKQ